VKFEHANRHRHTGMKIAVLMHLLGGKVISVRAIYMF